MKLIFASFLILTAALSGCETSSHANARVKAAYIAGENAAYQRIAAVQRTSVVVIGAVERPNVPWKSGLTLARAIVAAGYTGQNPREITLLRQGVETKIDPKSLLHGHDVPLQPGDTVTIRQ